MDLVDASGNGWPAKPTISVTSHHYSLPTTAGIYDLKLTGNAGGDPMDLVQGLAAAAAHDQRAPSCPRSLWHQAMKAADDLGCALTTDDAIDGGFMRTRVRLETKRGYVTEWITPGEGELFERAWERTLRAMGLLD